MKPGGRGYRQVDLNDATLDDDANSIAIDVRGEPIYDEPIRLGDYTFALVDLLTEDGHRRGVRGWRLA